MNEIRAALAGVEWTNAAKCMYRRSGSGNVVGSDGTGDVFVVLRDGTVKDVQGRSRPDDPEIKIPRNGFAGSTGTSIPTRIPPKELDASQIAPQVQGELNSNVSSRGSAYVDRFVVTSMGTDRLYVTPFANSNSFNGIKSIVIRVRKGQTMSDVLEEAKRRAETDEFVATLSERFRDDVMYELEDRRAKSEEFLVPKSLIGTTPYAEFYEWVGSREESPAPNVGRIETDGTIRMTFLGIELSYRPSENEVRIENEFALAAIAELTRKNRRSLEAMLAELDGKTPYEMRVNQTHVYGYATVGGKKVKFKQKDGEISVRNLRTLLSETKKAEEAELAERTEIAAERARKSPLYGSATAAAIADAVSTNPGSFTAKTLAEHLQTGESPKTNSVVDSYYSGILKYVDVEDVRSTANELLAEGFLSTRGEGDGIKRRLFPADGLSEFVRYGGSPAGKSLADLTDFDWLMYMKKEVLFPSERRKREEMAVLDHPAAFCVAEDEFVEFVAKKPDYWLEYVETMRSVERGTKRKYWKELKTRMLERKKPAGDETAEMSKGS